MSNQFDKQSRNAQESRVVNRLGGGRWSRCGGGGGRRSGDGERDAAQTREKSRQLNGRLEALRNTRVRLADLLHQN